MRRFWVINAVRPTGKDDAFGISLAQFFAGDGMRPDLTDEQEEILETWDNLNADERRILMNFVRSLKK